MLVKKNGRQEKGRLMSAEVDSGLLTFGQQITKKTNQQLGRKKSAKLPNGQ
jgi:hypothetical protein